MPANPTDQERIEKLEKEVQHLSELTAKMAGILARAWGHQADGYMSMCQSAQVHTDYLNSEVRERF